MNETSEMRLASLENLFKTIEENIKNGGYDKRDELLKIFEDFKSKNPEYSELLNNKETELVGLYDSLNPTEANIAENIDYEVLLAGISKRIEAGEFSSKEELANYLNEIKNNGIPSSVLTSDKITEFLKKYDELNMSNESPLNMENYKSVSLEDKELITSKKTDSVLVTNSQQEMNEEFKSVQNELTSMTPDDGLANANSVFETMQENQKEELKFIPLSEFNYGLVDDPEVLKKISFFLSNANINPYEYRINPQNGYFYNVETQEIYEVRKNEQTGKYEIYRGGEKMYTETTVEETVSEEQTESEEATREENNYEVTERPEEEMAYENKNVKVRRLIKPKEQPRLDNAAYISNTFIIIISLIFIVVFALILSQML